ncbi:hypothetical protein BH11PLA2_BH11PLA2_03440 [soil metagenome]
MTATLPEASDFVDEFAENSAYESGQQYEYLDHCRRIAVGPSVSLVFENHKTLSFRVREVEKLSRVYPPASVRRMLDWYAGLLPDSHRLTAAVTVRRPGRRPNPGLNGLADAISAGQIFIRIGDTEILGDILPTRAGDRILGAAFWVSFNLDDVAIAALADFATPAFVSVISDEYIWDSDLLHYDVRRSLVEDMERRTLRYR